MDAGPLRRALARLEVTWQEMGAPTAERLAPGRSAASTVAALDEIGLYAGSELTTWFE